jgi:hypothetical protein
MTFTPESNPQVRALAREASQKIKTLTDAHNAQIEAIYRNFRTQADAIKTEASADEMDTPSADLLPPTDKNID